MWDYLLFAAGFPFLIKGADILIDGAASIARKFKIKDIVIGLTIVSFGTSAPELVVNLLASIKGSGGLALGNIVGSNIANTLLILGVSAMIYPITVQVTTVYKEIPFCLLASVVLFLMANDILIDHDQVSMLSRIDGLLLLSFFAIFLYYVYSIAKSEEKAHEKAEKEMKELAVHFSIFYIIAGALGLMVGGYLIVEGAVKIARSFSIAESTIGLTIVAIGTSLPELATSAMAAHKRNADIAIGNVIGSNMFNIFWVLGSSATIRSIGIEAGSNTNLLLMLFSALLLLIFLFFGIRHTLERWQGVFFVLIYISYITYLTGFAHS